MLRIRLSPGQQEDLRARTRRLGLAARTRDRRNMIRLADAGWHVPQIARHLGYHEQTVRKDLKGFLAAGIDCLPDRPRLARPARVSTAHLDAVETLLDTTERTWTVLQLAAWLAEQHWVGVISITCGGYCTGRAFGGNAPIAPCAINRMPPPVRRPRR
jgi:transposase